MRVLLVSNTTLRCGVAQMGRRMFCALTGAPDEKWEAMRVWGPPGDQVVWWPADHPHDIPEVGDQFDVIHLNYHPGTVGHILPHKPERAKLSVYFHEPGTGQEWWDLADLRITSEPREGAKYLPVPVPDYIPESYPPHQGLLQSFANVTGAPVPVRIGHSSIRRDGIDWVEPAISRHPYWHLDCSSEWLSDEQEIERLAACDLTIFHPHSGNPGQSSAVVMGIAAQRPLLINSSPMLRTLWDSEEVYRYEDPEVGIQVILDDLRAGRARYPLRLAEERSWKRAAETLRGWWGELL
jgi:hypothetical protein